MQVLLLRRCLAVCFALFGYFGAASTGVVPNNSNLIKSLPAGAGGRGADSVSPSPRTSAPGGMGHKLSPDTFQQSGVCTDDEDCGGEEFCNDARGVCLPCRRSRKRCVRDSMCCAGTRCSNGFCQAHDIRATEASIITTGWHKHNHSTEHQGKRPSLSNAYQGMVIKGQEGEACLRSADCSEGLCCARHFWSRICKPVLTEGQVCTRHRKKGNHGLELFQRCDCGEGLSCRPERGGGEREREHGVSRTAVRNLHTCQRR